MKRTQMAQMPFQTIQRSEGGRLQPFARFVCVSCQAHFETKFPYAGKRDGPILVERAERLGWEIKGGRLRCPACAKARERPPPKRTDIVVLATALLEKKQMAVSPIPVARAPSADQRQRIRALLDANFDDAKGRYLEGFSDQKIADDLSVPRVFVEQIREAAYGPIRVSPDAEKLGQEIKAALDKLANMEKELAALRQSVSGFDVRMKAFL